MNWAKNLLFITLCSAGLIAVAANLLKRERELSPREYQGGQFTRARLDSAASPPSAAEGDDFVTAVKRLNQEFHRHWQLEKISQTAEQADELTICRRLSLALTGAVPSVEEIRAAEKIRPEERVEWWVAHLLEDRRCADYLAERFTRAYVGTEDGPFILYRRRRFVAWLADQLEKNTRYDEVVRKLISDKGLWNGSPAVNFVTVTAQQNKDNRPDEIRLAGRTTRAFLGMRIDCLQCHDDKLGNINLGDVAKPHDGQQADFHQLAAFFSEAKITLMGVRDEPNEYKYKYLHADQEVQVPPKVPYGQEIFDGQGTRREQLARWVTNPQNKPFARATVNRVWALLMGRPLVEPIDNIPLTGEYPPGLQLLADDFISHQYDLRRLIRLIAASEVFQLSSRSDLVEITARLDQHWAAFPVTRLRPEQVAQSVIQASSLRTIDADSNIIAQLQKFAETNEFVKRFGDIGEDEFTDRGGTIPQRLLMMNGELVDKRTMNSPLQNAATRIVMLNNNPEKMVEAAFLATLSRGPTDDELTHFTKRLTDAQGESRVQVMEDLYWSLLNCTEFSWNH